MTYDPGPLVLSLKLALFTVSILFVAVVPLAWWLAHGRSLSRSAVQALANLPLILPPSVLGFYLLVVFSPSSALGATLLKLFGVRLVFSFEGLVVASLLFNLPFMLNPILAGFEALPNSLLEASYVLGKSRLVTLWRVVLPNLRPALLAGLVMTFAHTIGEFGVVLMIGGKIPDVTRVASIAVYDEVEALNYGAANFYAAILLGFSFAVLLLLFGVNRRAVRTV